MPILYISLCAFLYYADQSVQAKLNVRFMFYSVWVMFWCSMTLMSVVNPPDLEYVVIDIILQVRGTSPGLGFGSVCYP